MKHRVFMISGKFRVSNKIFTYFFCIDASTKIGELRELWNEARLGVLRTQSRRDISSAPANGIFGVNKWTGQIGLETWEWLMEQAFLGSLPSRRLWIFAALHDVISL
jgi:hypothetical protein